MEAPKLKKFILVVILGVIVVLAIRMLSQSTGDGELFAVYKARTEMINTCPNSRCYALAVLKYGPDTIKARLNNEQLTESIFTMEKLRTQQFESMNFYSAGESISGDNGILTLKSPKDESRSLELKFIKQNGLWKLKE